MQQIRKPILGALALALLAMPALAGTLRLGEPTVQGDQYTFPVYLQGDNPGVAALDFRLAYDPAVFSPVTAQPGPSAASAQKQVSSNVSAPGEMVVVMMGFNQNTVSGGQVAEIVLQRVPNTASASSVLRINEPTMATANGEAINSRGLPRTVRFDETKESRDEQPDRDPGDSPADPQDPARDPGNDADPVQRDRNPGAIPIIIADSANPPAAGDTTPGAPATANAATTPAGANPAANAPSPENPGNAAPGAAMDLPQGQRASTQEPGQPGSALQTAGADAAKPNPEQLALATNSTENPAGRTIAEPGEIIPEKNSGNLVARFGILSLVVVTVTAWLYLRNRRSARTNS